MFLFFTLVACGGNETTQPLPPPPAVTGSISGSLTFPGGIGTTGLGNIVKTGSRTVTASSKESDIIPGELIVQFRPGLQTQSLSTLSFGKRELRLERSMRLPDASRFQLYKAADLDKTQTLQLANQLRANPDVLSVSVNRIYHSYKEPNDAFYAYQWHYPAMNMPNAWNLEDGTQTGLTVAVVDTGIVIHPDLQANLLPGYDFVSDPTRAGDGDARDADPTDLGGVTQYHGTHVAGTVAATTNNADGVAGVNWGAKVVPVRVLDKDGSGSVFDIVEGTLWAAGFAVEGVPANPNPAKVLNLSLGGTGPCQAIEQQAYQSIRAAGAIVIVAAGNENTDVNFTSPSNCGNVISVGATGPTNQRSYYSNYGSLIDIMAPGGDLNYSFEVGGQSYQAGVLSTVFFDDTQTFGADFMQGTSMAAPHIAGLVSLMLAQNPNLSFDEIRQRLQASATPLSAEACTRPTGNDCGPGLVDAAKALNAGGSNPNPNPNPTPAPPPTGNLTTYVAAFFCSAPNCGLPNNLIVDESRSAIVELQPTQLQAPYTVPGLTGGTYVAAAWQDINGDQIVDDNEPFGIYASQGNPLIVLSNGQSLQNIGILLETTSPGALRTKSLEKADLRSLMTPLLER